MPSSNLPPIRVCVIGVEAPAPEWLRELDSHLPATATRALIGAWVQAVAGWPDARRVAAPSSDDPLALVARLAQEFHGESLLVLRAGITLPPFAIERLQRALEIDDALAALGMDDVEPQRSPLPAGSRSDVDPVHLDALCYAFGDRRLMPDDARNAPLSLWHGARMAKLGAAAPDDADALAAAQLRIVLLDHLYAAIGSKPLRGAPDGDPRDPAPPSLLAPLRAHVVAALEHDSVPGLVGLDEKPVLLHVLHGWGGGARHWVDDLAAGWPEAHHLVLLATGSFKRQQHGQWLELRDAAFVGPPLRRVPLPQPIADTALADAGYRAVLDEILRDFNVDAVIVSSLIGHSLDALRTGLPTVRVIHDHYPLWPVLHRDFGDMALRFDAAQRGADLAATGPDREFANTDPAHWQRLRDGFVAACLQARVRQVAPSRSALANDLRLAPELATLEQHVIPHSLRAWPGTAPLPSTPPLRPRLRLVVVGRIRRGKGAELLLAALPALREYADIFLLGAGADAHALFGEHGVHVLLDYQRDQLPELLAGIAPDAALLLPTVAETFSYTLSELRSLGMPVIASRVGALAERIDDGEDGFLVEPQVDAIIARVAALAADRPALAHVHSNLLKCSAPTLATMGRAYAQVCPLSARAPARYRLAPIDAAQLGRAADAELIAKLREQQSRTHKALADALRQSEQRGDWGHSLDRELARSHAELQTAHAEQQTLHAELDERTRWALGLDAQLQHIKPHYELMLGSTSWAITAPLRSMAARLREARARAQFARARLRSTLGRVRGSLARRGLIGTMKRAGAELRGPRNANERYIRPPPSEQFAPFAVPSAQAPRASIVIPVYNKIAYTIACLRSLAEHAGECTFEVIVVDDGSSDATVERLAQVDGIRVIRNAQNLGFVGSCNAGAAAARGDFVAFLNNDTVVTTGWLDALLRCFDERPDAGLVGARLVYPDGRLQEAGGIIFNDGSGWNYGRFEDPDDPRFVFRREADYCSGAAIAIRRALFAELGGFDQRYAPAYYEDTDLAFAVRAHGLKVYYEPTSTVVHFEGITAGTDTASGIKRYQLVNQEKFVAKWRDALARQPAPDTPIVRAASHRARQRVLIVDATTPMPDQDSGSLRMVNLMRVLRDLDCQTSFLPANRAYVDGYTAALQSLGVEALYHPFLADQVAWFRERGPELDAIILSRHYVAAAYVGLARLYAPRARLIFDTVDLHYLREQRAAELEGKPELARLATTTRAQELKLMRECDLTLVVSPVEKELLTHDVPGANVEILSNVHDVHGCRKSFAQRRDLVFVGGFQHPPNADAVIWFVREVFPLLRKQLTDVRFHVIGSKMTDSVQALADDRVLVHGFVEDIAPYMDDCRISVAPLRYGAGVKGKVNLAMSYGLPVAATTIAVEGMHVRNEQDVLVADDPAGFAANVVRLYRDEELWQRLSEHGLDNVRRHFSLDAARTAVARILQR